ncbi:MAG TPA: DedA family protein [Spirochaetia bacterium]|nr:DedA family protein [Spirochaetia bacterium]
MSFSLAELRPLLDRYGYLAVFGAILLEDFGVPMPGETLLIAGAILASQGDLHIVPLVLIAWTAAVLGDNIGYAIGRLGGRELVVRYGRYVFLTEKRLKRAETFFHRRGGLIVLVARFFEILRQLNGIIAGIMSMSWWRFFTFNALGAALWVGFWSSLFFLAGREAGKLAALFKRYELFIIGGAGLPLRPSPFFSSGGIERGTS